MLNEIIGVNVGRREAAIFILLVLSSPLAWSHHSEVVTYDQDREIAHQDVTVLEWQFSNPHARIIFEAPDDSGELIEWRAQSTNANRLARFGYNQETFQPGEVLSIVGNPTRDGRPEVYLRRVTRSDGTVVNFVEDAAAFSAEPSPAEVVGPIDRLDDDERGFTGVWENIFAPIPPEVLEALVPEGAYFWAAFRQAPEPGRGEIGDLPLTAKGRAVMDQWKPSDDECRPTTAWRAMQSPYLQQFEAPMGGRLHIRTEYLDIERTIWLDGREHPPLSHRPRSLQGHSVGYWEGDTLVAETTGMFTNLVTRSGIYHSENAVIRERFSREGDVLTVLRNLEDPEHFSQPLASVLRLRLTPYPAVNPYGTCTPQQSDAQ